MKRLLLVLVVVIVAMFAAIGYMAAETNQMNAPVTQAAMPAKQELVALPGYSIASVEDISFASTIRLRVRVQLDAHAPREVVLAVAQAIADDLGRRQNAKAVAFFFSGPNASAEDGYDVARVQWAPNGVWGDAANAKDGDYSSHRLTMEDYIEPVSNETGLVAAENGAMFDIPLPEGAELASSTPSGPDKDASEEYEVSASKPDLIGFYQLNMPKAGWQITSTFSEGTMVFWKKGSFEVAITVNENTVHIMGAEY